MASYVVMEPPASSPSAEAVLVRDGFAFLAFVFAPLWLLGHRLWIEAALTFAVLIGLAVLGETAGFRAIAPLLSLGLSVYIGLEGGALRVNALRRRGWSDAGVVDAGSVAEAEIRYAASADDHGLAAEPMRPFSPVAPAPAGGQSIHGPALGLLQYPGRN